jgi:hypothetical protein
MQLLLIVLQHWPATHALPGQQVWPLPPHPPQLPPKHIALFAHVLPGATQLPVSQQPLPAQTLLAQQTAPLVPQFRQLPPPQTVFGCEHCVVFA